MAINIPTSVNEVFLRMLADVQSALPQINPFLDQTFVNANTKGNAGRIYDVYVQLNQIIPNLFPTTANSFYATMWGSFKRVSINAATQGSGNVVFTGLDGSVVPQNTLIAPPSGKQYSLQQDANISFQSINILSLIRTGTLVTVTTNGQHNLATANTVTISGADQTEYNITTSIIVIALDKFTYVISSSPTTPATGVTVASYTSGIALVKSVEEGIDTNQSSGTVMNILTPISGVDSSSIVGFEGITGGTNIETLSDFEKRYVYLFQNPVTPFNVSEITTVCKSINGVTRVFVYPTTPGLGQVTVYFVRDNDPNIIPTSNEIIDVTNAILTILPVNMSPDYLFVLAPIPKIVDFNFSELSPNTASMQQSIIDVLKETFAEQSTLGINIPEHIYTCALYETIDTTTGQKIQSFTLISPIGDIILNSNEIAILGNVVFP